MKARRRLRSLHRDVGYLCAGLTVVYAVSGLAVNHIHQWNPSYEITHRTVEAGPAPPGADVVAHALAKVGDATAVRSSFQTTPETLAIYTEASVLTLHLPTGRAVVEEALPRPVLYPLNAMHLNKAKGAWTAVADVYALLLLFLGASGLFLVRGRHALHRRGAVLAGIGLCLPLTVYFW